mmetsp:Transcript_29705/g.57895  ORF Transcript_29705/g.57895 Transcript_29705/m.57895 type:complete len:310 (-) Transcript_29705:379-1308(-)
MLPISLTTVTTKYLPRDRSSSDSRSSSAFDSEIENRDFTEVIRDKLPLKPLFVDSGYPRSCTRQTGKLGTCDATSSDTALQEQMDDSAPIEDPSNFSILPSPSCSRREPGSSLECLQASFLEAGSTSLEEAVVTDPPLSTDFNSPDDSRLRLRPISLIFLCCSSSLAAEVSPANVASRSCDSRREIVSRCFSPILVSLRCSASSFAAEASPAIVASRSCDSRREMTSRCFASRIALVRISASRVEMRALSSVLSALVFVVAASSDPAGFSSAFSSGEVSSDEVSSVFSSGEVSSGEVSSAFSCSSRCLR